MVTGSAVEPSATEPKEPGYTCSVCSKTYKRREHLQRHASSHNPLRPHRCSWCNNTYQRADVLKRHSQVCQIKATANGALVGGSSRRRACDRCVRQKKACSTGQPCDGCRRKSAQCSYSAITESPGQSSRGGGDGSRTEDAPHWNNAEPAPTPRTQATSSLTSAEGIAPGHLDAYAPVYNLIEQSAASNTNWLDFFNLAVDNLPSDQPCSELESYRFSFLDNFTRRSGLADSFECCTMPQREAVMLAFEQAEIQQQNPNALESESCQVQPIAVGLSSASTSSDPLIIKTHQILQRIQEVVTLKPRNSCVTMEWSAALEQGCLEFFSPKNLRKFLALYWELWHPNVNIIHRPSFSPACSKSILIAGMALIGEWGLIFVSSTC